MFEAKFIDNAPIPETVRGGAAEKYPLAQMKVGQAYDWPVPTTASCVTGVVAGYSRRHGMKFSVRKTETGWRVWRTA